MRTTRREALVAGAVATGAVLAGAAPGAAAVAPRLSARRASAFRALVASLQQAPDARFARWDAMRATARLRRWYAQQPPALRAHADAVLDGLARRPAPSYARLARAQSASVAAAVALAATVCDPPPDDDERPLTPGLAA